MSLYEEITNGSSKMDLMFATFDQFDNNGCRRAISFEIHESQRKFIVESIRITGHGGDSWIITGRSHGNRSASVYKFEAEYRTDIRKGKIKYIEDQK